MWKWAGFNLWLPNSHKVQCHARLNRVLPTHTKQGRKIRPSKPMGFCNETETTLQGSLTYPTKREVWKIIDSKMPIFWGYVSSLEGNHIFSAGPRFFLLCQVVFSPILFGLSGGRPPQEDDCQCQASYFRVEWTPSKRIEGIIEETKHTKVVGHNSSPADGPLRPHRHPQNTACWRKLPMLQIQVACQGW